MRLIVRGLIVYTSALSWDVKDNFEQFIKDFGVDVLNSHNVGVDYHLFRLNVDLPCTFISSLHGGYETVPELLEEDFLGYLQNQIDGWLYLAEKNRQVLLQAGLKDTRFIASFNAVESENIDWENREQFQREYGIGSDVFSLVICSRALLSKGWETCIHVMKLVNAWQSRPVHLFLIGDGPDLSTIKAKYERDEHVHLLGHVDSPMRLLKCFDLAIFPSIYPGESFPLFLLESLTAGLPIVSTDAGDIPRLIGAAEFREGALVSCNLDQIDMAEAMARLVTRYLQDKVSYREASENARRVSSDFTLDKLAAHYISAFQKIIAAKQDSSASGKIDKDLSRSC